jgi:hypothetical protein
MRDDDSLRMLENFRHRTLAELEHRLDARALARDEYERRVKRALLATSPNDLKPLLNDLVDGFLPVEPSIPHKPPDRISDDERDRDLVLACMSGATRNGHWEPAESVIAASLMGYVLIDFRDAALLEGTTRVHAFALMGGIKVIVPPDVRVEVGGIGFMGTFTHLRKTSALTRDSVIKVDGFAMMGAVEVKVLGYDEVDEEDEED